MRIRMRMRVCVCAFVQRVIIVEAIATVKTGTVSLFNYYVLFKRRSTLHIALYLWMRAYTQPRTHIQTVHTSSFSRCAPTLHACKYMRNTTVFSVFLFVCCSFISMYVEHESQMLNIAFMCFHSFILLAVRMRLLWTAAAHAIAELLKRI